MKHHRYFSENVKQLAVERMAKGEAAAVVARDIGADRRRLYEWYRKYQAGGAEDIRQVGRPRKAEALGARLRSWQGASDEGDAARRQIAELERKIGQQQVDLDFFRKALRRVEEMRRAQAKAGAAPSTQPSKR